MFVSHHEQKDTGVLCLVLGEVVSCESNRNLDSMHDIYGRITLMVPTDFFRGRTRDGVSVSRAKGCERGLPFVLGRLYHMKENENSTPYMI